MGSQNYHDVHDLCKIFQAWLHCRKKCFCTLLGKPDSSDGTQEGQLLKVERPMMNDPSPTFLAALPATVSEWRRCALILCMLRGITTETMWKTEKQEEVTSTATLPWRAVAEAVFTLKIEKQNANIESLIICSRVDTDPPGYCTQNSQTVSYPLESSKIQQKQSTKWHTDTQH